MEVWCSSQLPVLPLDRPVPQHVLRRRGAISLGPSAALFGGPSPRQLCKRRGGVSYNSADQAVLYLHLLGDVRHRGPGPSAPEQPAPHSHAQVDYQSLHRPQGPGRPGARSLRGGHRRFSFQRFLAGPHSLLPPLHLLDQEYTGQVKCMLNQVDSWDFDIFLFDRFTNGNSLVTLTFHLFLQLGLTRLFRLDPIKLHRFLVMVQADYHQQNPYHSALHAADVTQAMYCYLREPQLAETLSSCDMLLALVAAVTHDLDHPGVNQGFLLRTGHHLAALYKNSSVLESHHWRSAVSLLRESGLLDHLPPTDRLNLEERLGSLVLATDISQQNLYLARFRGHLDRGDLSMADPSHRHLVLQITMKCTDICNPCRVWKLSSQWSFRVTAEFFHQGDMERKHGMAVSPLCDRLSDSTAHIQTGFIRHLVEPLFREWCRFSCTRLSRRMLAHLQTNLDRWANRSQHPETTC